MVRLACTKCERRGQYRKATLIERYGADANMVDLTADPSSRLPEDRGREGHGSVRSELSRSYRPMSSFYVLDNLPYNRRGSPTRSSKIRGKVWSSADNLRVEVASKLVSRRHQESLRATEAHNERVVLPRHFE
jgi:hypothetical protein